MREFDYGKTLIMAVIVLVFVFSVALIVGWMLKDESDTPSYFVEPSDLEVLVINSSADVIIDCSLINDNVSGYDDNSSIRIESNGSVKADFVLGDFCRGFVNGTAD